MKIILLWLRVQSAENSASAILANVVKDQYTFKLRTAAPTMSTTWFTHGVVTPVTAALTNPVTNDLSVKPRYCVTAVRLLSLVFFSLRLLTGPAPEQPTGTGEGIYLPRLISKSKTILYYGLMPLTLHLHTLSSTVTHDVQVFIQRFFPVEKITGVEGHKVNNVRSKYFFFPAVFFCLLVPF